MAKPEFESSSFENKVATPAEIVAALTANKKTTTANTEATGSKRKHEDESESSSLGETKQKDLKNLSKFSLNCTFSLKTKELKQKAYVLTQEWPSTTENAKRKRGAKKQKLNPTGSDKVTDDNGGDEDDDDDDDNDDDGEIREPTAEEIAASQKPKNMLSIITIREKKRKSHKKNLDSKDEREQQKNVQKITDYLQKWKNNRSDWRFEKLRQIHLMEIMFDEDKINSELWSIAVEYLAGSRGSAKDKIIQKAQSIIEDVDDEIESTGDNDLINQTKYQRAREILQNLQ